MIERPLNLAHRGRGYVVFEIAPDDGTVVVLTDEEWRDIGSPERIVLAVRRA